MVSEELLELINRGIAREIQVAIQYMWQHIQWSGVKDFTVGDELKSIAVTEMNHAKEIAERLFYLGEKPTAKPDPIFMGETLKEMIESDKKAEEEAIDLYKKIIKKSREEGDEKTNRIFRQILADEEEHHDTLVSLLKEI